jgi:hypothetical protein
MLNHRGQDKSERAPLAGAALGRRRGLWMQWR